MLYVQVSGPKKMKITLTTSTATPIARMKILHIAKTAIANIWNEDTTSSSIESAIIACVASWLRISIGLSVSDVELHPFSWVLIPNVVAAIWINLAHCCRVTWLMRRNLLISLSSFSSSKLAMKRPLNLPRNFCRSPLKCFVFKSPGFTFMLILWTVKMPALKRLCRKNCLICTCLSLPVPARCINAIADEESM